MGLNLSEGVQGIDYFRDPHDITWSDSIRQYFSEHVGQLETVGKYHLPKAQVAMLINERMARDRLPMGIGPGCGLQERLVELQCDGGVAGDIPDGWVDVL